VADRLSRVSGVADRYATALFELALEERALDAVESDLNRFESLLDESDDLMRLVRSPVFSAEQQARALQAVLEKTGICELVRNFLNLAAKNRRLYSVPDMIRAFRMHAADHRGEMSADVTTAEPMSDAHVDTLKAALKSAVGKDVTLAVTVDPTLIGGLVVKVGSRMIDTSLKTKLNSLKIAMKEAG
jgi:F-type H+-transporting ATPase subunit delta